MLGKLIQLRIRGMLSRQSTRNGKRGGKGMMVFLLIVFAFCFLTFGVLFYQMFHTLAASLSGTPLAWYYFALAALMSFALSFIGTAFAAKTELFEARDNELLLSMPLPPHLILMSRIAVLLLSEYAFTLLVLLPAGLAWHIAAGFSAGALMLFLLGGLLLPLLGTAASCLAGWLLALLTSRVRNKSLMTTVFSLLLMAAYFYFYFNANRYIRAILENSDALAERMAIWGVLFRWFGEGAAQGALVPALGFAAICLIAIGLTVLLLSRGFVKITTTNRGGARKKAATLEYRPSGVRSALYRRELKHFISSPAYMLNCGLGLILTVAAAVALFIKQADIRALLTLLAQETGLSISALVCGGAILLCFLSAMNLITAPAISIEGKTLWILRSSPVPASMVLRAKLCLHLSLGAVPTLLLSVVAGILLRVNFFGWLSLLILPQLAMLLTASFGLMMNLLLPKFDWLNETAAVKQSMSVLATTLTRMVYDMLSFVGFIVFVVVKASLSAAMTLLLTALACLWLARKGTARFDKL